MLFAKPRVETQRKRNKKESQASAPPLHHTSVWGGSEEGAQRSRSPGDRVQWREVTVPGLERHVVQRPFKFDRTNPGWRQPPAQRAFETPPGLESGSSPFSHVCVGRQRRRAAARIGRPVAQPEYISRGSARAGKTSRRGPRGFGIPSPTELGQTLRAGRRQAQVSQGRSGLHWETRHDEPALSGGQNGSHEGTSNSAIKPPLRHRHRSLSSIPAERGPFAGPNGAEEFRRFRSKSGPLPAEAVQTLMVAGG
jgi:hypothetical protein